MSTTPVLRLDAFRGRKKQRVERTLLLLTPDEARRRLGELVAEAMRVASADRGALVWIDEFGPVAPRAHVVLDLLAERPRRDFDVRVLHRAWDFGVPGAVDLAEPGQGPRPGSGDARNTFCVCLGSDGLRTWFLVVDSMAGRRALGTDERARMLHIAGQCTTVVLNREMLQAAHGPRRTSGFTGWTVLSDIDLLDASEDRISERFLILRVVRTLLDDELDPEPAQTRERVRLLREQLTRSEELPHWEAVLQAVEARDPAALASAVLRVGLRAEEVGEFEGAIEAFRSGYWIAALAAEEGSALEGARYLGRTLRRVGRWDDSEFFYGHAVELARQFGDVRGEALALDGLAATIRTRGNLPGARRVLDDALKAAERSGDAHAVGSVHQHLMTVHHLAGSGDRAIEHGWASVGAFESPRDRLRALVSLAGILLDLGEVELAELAYGIALERLEETYYMAFAVEGHAHSAALLGDREIYERRYARLTEELRQAGGVDFQVQSGLYRGRAYRALGDDAEAERWFREALAMAEHLGLNAYVFEAETALQALADGQPEPGKGPYDFDGSLLAEVRGGLEGLRLELVGA